MSLAASQMTGGKSSLLLPGTNPPCHICPLPTLRLSHVHRTCGNKGQG